jgi:hypothetical protein
LTIAGRDTAGRILRISRHAELDRVVLSIWDAGRCVGTVRLATEDVPELVRALVGTLVPDVPPPGRGLTAAPPVAPAGTRGDPVWAAAIAWAGRARAGLRGLPRRLR